MADCLRGEISEYGQLLHLFEEQQHLIVRGRDPARLLQMSREVEAQVEILERCRSQRERAVASFATANGRPDKSTVRSLLSHVPADGRALVEALIAEVNLLIHRVRRSSRQNHRMLATTVECHEEVLRRLRPDAFTKVYASDGRVSVAKARSAPIVHTQG